jgi:hypothetical protein
MTSTKIYQVYMCIFMYNYVCTYIHIYSFVYVHMYICMYIYEIEEDKNMTLEDIDDLYGDIPGYTFYACIKMYIFTFIFIYIYIFIYI